MFQVKTFLQSSGGGMVVKKELILVFVIQIEQLKSRVVRPNFGHPALTPSYTKYNFFSGEK